MIMKAASFGLGVALLALPPGQRADAGDAPAGITLHYYERPPLHYTNPEARASGFIIEKTERVLNQSGISYTWQVTPANRILALIKSAPGNHCAPGWYKNAERAAYARFSDPIYRDKPLVGLSRTNFNARNGITARDLFLLQNLRLLLKQNFSQGAYMDALIDKMPAANIQRVSADVPVMVKMIKRGRGDLIITTQEEVANFIASAGFQMDDFKVWHFPDVPAAENRYILCSKNVPAETIQRINEAIQRAAHPSPSRRR